MGRRVVSPSMIQEDYDRISRSYNDSFSRHVIRHSDELIEALHPQPGWRVADLACGTGGITAALAGRVGPNGSVTSIDLSEGMLNKARERLEREQTADRVQWVQGDMLQGAQHLPAEAFDAVTCGWAIGYTNVPALFRAARKALKKGGRLAIIENRRDTLEALDRAALDVAKSMPGKMERVMDLQLRLPKDEKHLARLFRHVGLKPVRLWNGEERFEFDSGRETLDWVLSTGAGAGFHRVMAPEVRAACDERFIQSLEAQFKDRPKIVVAHRYAAGLAVKE